MLGACELYRKLIGLVQQHLGPAATRVLAERNLSLPITIFSPVDADIRILQAGNVTAQEAEGDEWRKMEEDFAKHEGKRSFGEGKKEVKEAVVGGE